MPAQPPANPFTPSFGEIPLFLAGRDRIVREMTAALGRPNRSPELTTLISGARGTGKTALLAKIAEIAEQSGWVAVKAIAAPGMLEDIATRLGKPSGHVGTYKERLLRAGVIGEPDRNAVEFELPGFREFLLERLGAK